MKDEGVAEQGIAIGYDRRFLSKEAAIWASEVFAAEGVPVKFILGSAPTPLIMFFVMRHEMPYGMMITASHNPAVYNGIKVFTKEAATRMNFRHRRLNGIFMESRRKCLKRPA